MFCQPACAVGSCSSGPPAARIVGTKSTGGFYRCELSPCTSFRDLPHRQSEPAALSGAAARGGGQRRPLLGAALSGGLGDGGAARGQRQRGRRGRREDEALQKVLQLRAMRPRRTVINIDEYRLFNLGE